MHFAHPVVVRKIRHRTVTIFGHYIDSQVLNSSHRLYVLVVQRGNLQPLHQDCLVVLLQLLDQLRNLSFVNSQRLGFEHRSLLDLPLVDMLPLNLLFAFATLLLFP